MSGLFEKLRNYADSDCLPMHMPGHKRRMGELGNPFFIDITEIDGFDDLHHAEGILKEAQEKAARLYGSEETHYLINGSTAGLLAAVSGCTSYGGRLLMARNSHKASYHGALLKNLELSFLYPAPARNAPDGEEVWINGCILPEDVEKALEEDSGIQAVLITSPTYDGVVSDVEAIAGAAHRHGVPLIVDEAHGAHFPFSSRFPRDSVSCGADVVIHSLHKTLPSLTQTAMIHLNGPRIDREKLRRYLSVYQSSSPSYVLMASLDQCVDWIMGHPEAFEEFGRELERLRTRLLGLRNLKLLQIPGMDPSKLLLSVQGTGMDGRELSGLLRSEYGIELEMACSSYVCGIASVADTRESLKRFGDAVLDADRRLKPKGILKESGQDQVLRARSVCSLQRAEEAEKEKIPLALAKGRVSGDFVMLYPPGIPILTPGEEISSGILKRLLQYEEQGFEIHGAEHGFLRVLKRRLTWEKSYA